MKKRLLFLLFSSLVYAQNPNLTPSYQSFAGSPREELFVHLNKSTYIKGESLGFTAYVFNKADKKLFEDTHNLYCVITDVDGDIVKSKLIQVKNGIANSVFQLDSLFTSGEYTFKAYTNHMRNFNERNYYAEQIRIIDPNKETVIKQEVLSTKIDAQFLPEGGHLVANVPNVVGVVVKDSLGFGTPYLSGILKNTNGDLVSSFSVNEFGIGKLFFAPKSNTTYYVEMEFNDKIQRFDIKNIEQQGIAMQLVDIHEKVALTFFTNKETLPKIKNKTYQLAIHNGNDIKTIPIVFENSAQVTKVIQMQDLYTGMNIFTLFDDKDNPILERLFFNYEGINILKSDAHSVIQKKDSVHIKLNFKAIDTTKFNNISISVLPEATQTYKHHHNIISYTHLQPYVKGFIEQADYYFRDIDKKKTYDLDNLLLTQGWSAYNWETILDELPAETYPFEKGISIKALVEKQKEQQFFVHPINGSQPDVLSITREDTGFYVPNTFLRDVDTLKISKLQSGGGLIHSNLNLEFSPNIIPNLQTDFSVLGNKDYRLKYEYKSKPFTVVDLKDTQVLDEVVVTGKANEARNTKIIATAQGRVDFFNEDRNDLPSFFSYIQTKGFMYYVKPSSEEYDPKKPPEDKIAELLVNVSNKELASIYINGTRVRNPSVVIDELKHLPMDRFDYVITNRNRPDLVDASTGKATTGGIIRIQMRDLTYLLKNTRLRFTTYKAPLTFSSNKTFYVPKYQSYQDDFFKDYGVIGWFPINQVNTDGSIAIKFQDNFVDKVKLFIEGTANDGSFISEIKSIILNKNLP